MGYLFQTVYIPLTLVYMPRLLEIMFCIIVIIIESFNPINRRRPTILLVSFHIIFSRAIFGLFFTWAVLICCGIKSNTCFVNAI